MHLAVVCLLAAGVGVVIAHFISRAPELRSLRLSQLVLVPAAMALAAYFSSSGDMAGFISFLAVLVFLVALLAPNVAYLFGAGLSNFLDPGDWTPLEEEIALRPIRRLIDRDNFRQALEELDKLLQKHKPTYEAVLLKARLLHHIGRVDEAAAALLSLIELTNSTAQQLAVMEMLGALEGTSQPPPGPPASGARRVQIRHELVLFSTVDGTDGHKVIPPGAYEVREIIRRDRLWLRLAEEDWGNAEICWNAIAGIYQPPVMPAKSGFVAQMARMSQRFTGKSRRQLLAESQKLFAEANQLIRRDDWLDAVPLLQKASECDPDRYEIAYRWVQAVRQTSDDATTARVVKQVLEQSQWSADQGQMIEQLHRPLAK
jgi:thioredoxin-like negative regulator of GroEL